MQGAFKGTERDFFQTFRGALGNLESWHPHVWYHGAPFPHWAPSLARAIAAGHFPILQRGEYDLRLDREQDRRAWAELSAAEAATLITVGDPMQPWKPDMAEDLSNVEKEARARVAAGRPWTVVVFSRNRPQQLADLLHALEREVDSGVRIDVRVYDNASEVDLSEPLDIIQRKGWQFRKTEHYHDKREIWRWVNQAYQELNDAPQDTMLAFFPQDIRLCQHFFPRAQEEWESIDDPRKITLTVLVDAQREKIPCWTGVPPQRRGRVYRTQWVDNAFVAELSYLQALSFRIPPVPALRWKRNPNLSSGVGQMISVHLHRAGFGLYRVENSLVDFIGYPVPKYLQTVRFIDTLVPFAGGATQKVHRWRKTHSRSPAVHTDHRYPARSIGVRWSLR